MNKKILSVVLILCLMLAVMPMTAYAADIALCTKCGQRQTVRVTRQYANDKWHRCDLTCTVCDNTWDYWESHIWSGTATCTSGRTCTLCGGSSEPLGHDWGAWTQNSDEKTHTRICKRDTSHTETENCHGGTATCIAKAVCTVCGGEYGEMAAHSFTAEKAEAQYLKSAATCTEKAIYYKSCAVCGLSSEGTADEATFFSGNALDHDWGAWTQNSDEETHTRICKRDTSHTETENCHGGTATCTAKAVCEDCETAYGEFAAHSFTAEKAEEQYLKSAATCTAKAVYYKSCTVCGEKGTETFSYGTPLDHDWGEWTQNNDQKTHTRICKRDASHTETENCRGGTATCTERAICDVCGGAYGDLAAHDFTAEVAEENYLKSEATCTEPAVYYKSCKACGLTSEDTEQEDTFQYGNPLGHDYDTEWSQDETHHWYVCKRCQDVAELEEHTASGWITDKAATAKADGERHKECTVCGYILETDTIPATGSKTKPGKQDNTKTRTKTNAPKTGDDSTLLLWTALLGVSGVGVTGVVRYGRKRKDNE